MIMMMNTQTMQESSRDLQPEHTPHASRKQAVEVRRKVTKIHKASLKKRFEIVSEGISKPGAEILLNEIYTELYITEGESEGVNKEHEVWQVESASRVQNKEDTPINCNDIFKSLPGQEKHIRTVMTKGVAGIGKTVSVHKFILDWADDLANQDVDFMFPLSFRELNLIKNDRYSLHKLLLDFHPELKELDDDEYKDCKVVFIFDGLDESRLTMSFEQNMNLSDVKETSSVNILIASLIKGTLLSSALIWITSRPAAASQVPAQYVELITEVRGFNDQQKEEYFRKRISDENQANSIISHMKTSRSLHIMCHIPVFCGIAATVIQEMLGKKNIKDIPQTLTEMFIQFLLIQTRKDQKYQCGTETEKQEKQQKLLKSQQDILLKLAKLAFKNLESGNLMFYNEDLRMCDIDINEASVYSGMFTEIFKEESVFQKRKVYCFVHLSIQEFLAAVFAFYSYVTGNLEPLKSLLSDEHRQESKPILSSLQSALGLQSQDHLHVLFKRAVDEALKSKNGHLDLFLRFLMGISLESNQRLLLGLLNKIHNTSKSIKETCQYMKKLNSENLSPERCINLFRCLFEMNDHSMHEEIQKFLSSNNFKQKLSPAHCSALAHILLMSEEIVDEFDLKKYNTSDEGRRRLLPALRCCRKARLDDCKLTDKSCGIVATVLQSPNSLTELDLSNNNLGDSGVQLLTKGLSGRTCKLQTLRLSNCGISDEGYVCLTLTLMLNPSCVKKLDVTNNLPGAASHKLLSATLEDPQRRVETLLLVNFKLTNKSWDIVATVLQSSKSLVKLDLSHNDVGDSGFELLSRALSSPHCKLQTLRMVNCKLKNKSWEILASVLQSSNSLIELDLSNNILGDYGVQLLSSALSSPHCTLHNLSLCDCLITEKGCVCLVSALTSNMSLLKELDVINNHLGESGLKLLSAKLKDPVCKLEMLKSDHGVLVRGRSCLLRYACELTLDPDTANINLSLDEGIRIVRCSHRKQPYPYHPERFHYWWQVFCVESLSGRCYWEVEWSGVDGVLIAAAYRSIKRTGESDDVLMGCNAKSWSLSCSPQSHSVRHNNKTTDIPAPSSESRRVGVYLDWPAGTLSFYSVSSDALTHLHTFHSTFTEPVCPGFWIGYNSSVSLCQVTSAPPSIGLNV